MIKAGAFDCFGNKRSQLMACLDHAIEVGSKLQKDKDRGQLSFFKDFEAGSSFEQDMQQIPNIEEWSEQQLLAFEKEVLGFYISSHPLAKHAKLLKSYARATSATLPTFPEQSDVSVGGIIDAVIRKTTRKGDPMAFVKLQDLDGKCEIIFFPEAYRKFESMLKADDLVFIKGKNNSQEDEGKIIADDIMPLENVRNKLTRLFAIDLFTAGLDSGMLERLKEVLLKHPGEIPVHINFREPDGKYTEIITAEDFNVSAGDTLFNEVEALLGEDTIKIMT